MIGKRPHGGPRAGMLDRVMKDGSPYLAVKKRDLDREQ